MALLGWFVGGSIAGFGTGLLTRLLEHQRKRDDLRMREAMENAKMAEAVRGAMDSAAQIIEDHVVDDFDPTDYFTPEIREILAQRAMGYADTDPTPVPPGRPNRDTAATYEEANRRSPHPDLRRVLNVAATPRVETST